MQEATARAAIPFAPKGAPRVIVKSISAKHRPRHPGTASASPGARIGGNGDSRDQSFSRSGRNARRTQATQDLNPWTGAQGSSRRTWAEKDGRSPTIAFPELATNPFDPNLHPSLLNRNNCEPGRQQFQKQQGAV